MSVRCEPLLLLVTCWVSTIVEDIPQRQGFEKYFVNGAGLIREAVDAAGGNRAYVRPRHVILQNTLCPNHSMRISRTVEQNPQPPFMRRER